MPHTAAQILCTVRIYHIGAWRNRQTRGAQNAVGSAHAGSNPAAPTTTFET